MLRALKWYSKLSVAKYRKREGFFLAEGKRLVSQICTASPSSVDSLLCREGFNADFIHGFECYELPEKQFSALAHSGGSFVIAVVSIPKYKNVCEYAGKPVLALENVQDPGNVGTLIRTAAAFDFSAVLMSVGCADTFSDKVVDSSAGAILSLPVIKTETFYEDILSLKEFGYGLTVMDLDPTEEELFSTKNILAVGNEGNGVSPFIKNMADCIMSIPIDRAKVESLNVAVAGAIGMYRLCSRL